VLAAKGQPVYAEYCADCHGAAHDIAPLSATRTYAQAERIVAACSRCHDEDHGGPSPAATYRDNVHGQALFAKGLAMSAICTDCHGTHAMLPPTDPQKAVEEARAILWDKVAIIRDGKHLSEAFKRLAELPMPDTRQPSRLAYETCNILTVAPLIARCALAREESRGAHYRSDFPLKNETKSPRHSYITKVFPPFFV